jgi:RimJ/RimL family protein N-acetyltransferase
MKAQQAWRLVDFDPDDSSQIIGWPTSATEAKQWGGQLTPWPVDASVLAKWHSDPYVRPYVLRSDKTPVAYGEIWIDNDEQEVELARLIVAPERRGEGVGQKLVNALLNVAKETGLPVAYVRVDPDNLRAIACYQRCGFEPVSHEDQATYNEGQPIQFVWMQHTL